MYHIVKSKTGYQVVAIAGNGEVLSTSEVLKSKQRCITNLKSLAKLSISGCMYLFQDDTLKYPVVKMIDRYGIYPTDMEIPEPKYIPGKNPVKKRSTGKTKK